MTGIGFVIWLVLGLAVTSSYDKPGRDRIESGLLARINRATDEYIGGAKPARPPAAATSPSATTD